MNFLLSITIAASLSLAVSLNVDAVLPSRGEKIIVRQPVRNDYLEKRLIIIRQTAAKLESLGRQPLSREVPEKEKTEAIQYNRWLINSSQKLKNLADRWTKTLKEKSNRLSVPEMQDMNASFNMQYLQLQSKMQNENRQFSMVSNIMKTKHDTVKNAISNVR